MTFALTSSAFSQGERIPTKYTCDGDNASPPLTVSGVPGDTKFLVLLMDDPDVPKELRPSGVFDHWVVFNIPADTTEIAEGAVGIGIDGVNSRGTVGYTGPCPPSDHEPKEHRYFFRLYALDTDLSLPERATKGEVLGVMDSHILAVAELMGRCSRA